MSSRNDGPAQGFDDFFEVSVSVEASRERLYDLVTDIEGADGVLSVGFLHARFRCTARRR